MALAVVKTVSPTNSPHHAKPMVSIDKVTMSFGAYVAVQNVNLAVADGEFLAIVGPTGCGKSTILNAIAGLLKPSSGTVAIEGQPVRGIQNDIGYLFQQDALLPWKTALENVELGPMFKGTGAAERREQSMKWLAKVGLKGFEHRYPHQLSGGQRKRVQMAQALITGPKVILMDEPFSALDIHTRHLMQNELLRLWQEQRRAVVMITHDLEEAIALGDRVVVLAAGPRSHVIDSFPVDLRRPRDVAEIKLDPRFMDLYRNIWSSLRSEVEKSYERHD
ncbi:MULTISPECIES: ABC transporter ATP-binding protein [unclassified Mesorhizobium]|uniref:ABC transporter ATP-binding protein n=1 Tax=unclassified Mesorhizobium TaxID=325217 RepID=UPI000F7514FC|nr:MULTISPECIES: ABC transporter ATP-binding protein [unclassified Mesorhizobium]AZO20548.1 ABC transporter ATP-binding protein [Mesorhizobium sp. M1E.F.Ca.ET.045.02.1.1]RUW37264.1 ATP-binding cassette domain-containing protein [Mesorhizobium sp. M1E.F.Ca.ET.041.01.1.1]RUW85291.1 ATP-binding cassette domain-containing protein [Mesorhizobium sp. M1E.F.Ca.ET.063.01.1.1]RWD87552.1 MAG: ATP-binding cassette domain-containing protein [Mesorhizobium sp.]RWD87713.1 MAG: ATP-binding cassette domain-co